MDKEQISPEWIENNAWLIFRADFYPIYTERCWLWLSTDEKLIASFIKYWTRNWWFIYATNTQLWELIESSESTAKRCVKKLESRWVITVIEKKIFWLGTDRKMKYNNWRFKMNSQEIHWEVKLTPQQIENKNVGENLDISEKAQKNSNPSERSNWPVIKELYKKNNIIRENLKADVDTSAWPKKSNRKSKLVERELKKQQRMDEVLGNNERTNQLLDFTSLDNPTQAQISELLEVRRWFIELRCEKWYKQLTDRAVLSNLKVIKWTSIEDRIQIIENSVRNNWTWLFPLKKHVNNYSNNNDYKIKKLAKELAEKRYNAFHWEWTDNTEHNIIQNKINVALKEYWDIFKSAFEEAHIEIKNKNRIKF